MALSHPTVLSWLRESLRRAANPNVMSSSNNSDELSELKRRVKKLEEAVAALQAVGYNAKRPLLFLS